MKAYYTLLNKVRRRCGLNLLESRQIYQTIRSSFQTSSISKNETKPASKVWKEAASVLVVSPMNNSEPYSLGYLMVERSGTGRVMPGMWVFPGGNVDRVDSNLAWVELFQKFQNIDLTQETFFQDGAHIPEIYTSTKTEDIIPKQVSLRITAVRETFEEAGILLCRPKNIDPSKHLHNGMLNYEFEQLQDKKDVQAWQKRIRKNSPDFIELCRQLECTPDIHALYDWSNWLTPTGFKAKSRFDTMFYLTILPRMGRVVIDGNEAVKAQWISPSKIISDHMKKNTRLMPPQLYEFSRLRNLKTIKDLQSRGELRRQKGIERYFPVIKKAVDGTLFLLPGDDLYPNFPDYTGKDPSPMEEIPQSIAKLKDSSKNFHRGVVKDGTIMAYDINIARFGHEY